MSLISFIGTSSRRWWSLLYFVAMMLIAAAAADSEYGTFTSAIDGGLERHDGGVENVTTVEDLKKNVSMHGLAEPVLGGFKIISSLPADPVTVTCENREYSLRPYSLMPGEELMYPIDITHYVYAWQCDFEWIHEQHFNLLKFDVWNHDGLYGFLMRCDVCVWTVKEDGFYFLQDGDLFRIWQWTHYDA